VQAGERTNHLFRLANHNAALVIGTGDLSELALGWCTYGVGDHMSHYNVNASVPKTLISHLVRWVAESGVIGRNDAQVLLDILGTEISPNWCPARPTASRAAHRKHHRPVRAAGLQPVLRAALRLQSLQGGLPGAHGVAGQGAGPLAGWRSRHAQPVRPAAIKKNLGIFLDRFFRTSQFKRSCVPNAPKVGSGGSLSPRGDWRAPSDAQSVVWMEELRAIPVQE
jgi:NAD+ synthase (glutamine-hydrolysing)